MASGPFHPSLGRKIDGSNDLLILIGALADRSGQYGIPKHVLSIAVSVGVIIGRPIIVHWVNQRDSRIVSLPGMSVGVGSQCVTEKERLLHELEVGESARERGCQFVVREGVRDDTHSQM